MKIAVYGTLKEGHSNHRVIKGAKYLGEFTTKPEYRMYSFGGFPAITLTGDTPIRCEIYDVEDEDMLNGIFNLEGYRGEGNDRNFYDLKIIDTPYGRAGIFYIKDIFKYGYKTQIKSGIWQGTYQK